MRACLLFGDGGISFELITRFVFSFHAMPDQQIQSLDGQSFNAYVAEPHSGGGPGLIVIHEIFGINASVRAICDDFAKRGFLVVCPDLYWRLQAGVAIDDGNSAEWPRAFDLYKKFDTEAGVRDLLATLAFIRRAHGCSGVVGTVGFGMGGKLAYLMAARSDVECSVAYYPLGVENMLDEVSDIRTPLLLHLAEQDKFLPLSTRAHIQGAASRNPVIRTENYSNVEHSFARLNSPTYSESAAQRASSMTLSLLTEYLLDKQNK